MNTLDLIENRIYSLTNMLGPVNISNAESTEDIVDTLLSARTLLQGAVHNRDQNIIMNRADELEKYLDPNFLEESQKVRTKEAYLNALAPDLITTCEQLEKIKELEATLGAEYFRNIPIECTEKIKRFADDNAEFSQQSDLIEENIIAIIKMYGELQSCLLSSLSDIGRRLDAVVECTQQTKRDALLKDLTPAEGESP